MAEFSRELDVDGLEEFLLDYFGRKLVSILKENRVDGESFISLNRDKLAAMGITRPRDQSDLLEKIAEIRGNEQPQPGGSEQQTAVDNPDAFEHINIKEEDKQVTSQKELTLTSITEVGGQPVINIVIQTILPAHLWGWAGIDCFLIAQFKAKELKGDYFFECISSPSQGYLLFQGTVPIPVDTAMKHKGCFLYKYAVTSSHFSGYVSEELIYFTSGANRLLKIPDKYMTKGNTFRKYDVPIYPSDDIMQQLRHRRGDVMQFFANKFPELSIDLLPDPPPDDTSMREFSLTFHLVRLKKKLVCASFGDLNTSVVRKLTNSIESIYWQMYEVDINAQSFPFGPYQNKSVTASYDFKVNMNEWIFSTASLAIVESERFPDKHLYIITGAVLFLLLHHFDLMKELNSEELHVMMRLLHLVPDTENFKCPRFTALFNCLSDDTLQKDLASAIETACISFISQTEGKSIEWLRILPSYHFLKKFSTPFAPTSERATIKWSFWPKITERKKNMQKYIEGRYGRFDEFWLSLEDLMKLDAVLMKVLLYLCPEDQLHSILPRVPVLVATSYVSEICTKKKLHKDEEMKMLNMWLKGLQISVAECDWNRCAGYLFAASFNLHKIVVGKISCGLKLHLMILQQIFEHLLYVVSELCKHGKRDELKTYLQEISDHICSWIIHHNVIGGSSMGGNKASKLQEEIQMWVTLHEKVYCSDEFATEWKCQLRTIIEQRANQVSPNSQKVSVFLKAAQYHDQCECPEVIMDIFIRMAMDGLSLLKGDDAQRAMRSIISKKDDAANVSKLLSKFILKRPDVLYNDGSVSIDELLNWDVWPNFIEIAYAKEDPVFNAIDPQPASIITSALQKVLEIATSIDSGFITREDLRKLLLDKERSHRLLKAANVLLDISIFHKILEALDDYVIAVTTLFRNIEPCIEGYNTIEDDLRRDFNTLKMKDICPGWATGDRKVFVLSSELGSQSPLAGIVHCFCIMDKYEIFRKTWRSYREKLPVAEISQQAFVDEVWAHSLEDCVQLIITCNDGSAFIADVEILCNSFNQADIVTNLAALQEGLKKACPTESTKLPPKSDWVTVVAKKVDSYRSFKHCAYTAKNLLALKESLHVTGSYTLLESVAKDELNSRLKYVDDRVLKTSELLRVVSSEDKQDCLKHLIDCWDIVEWIAEDFKKDVAELQTFIDVAYTAANIADDELNIQKLNALRFVGNSIAKFLSVLNESPKVEVRDETDRSLELIEWCQGFWNSLEQNKHLPTLLRECKANIQWFKNIKDSQGAVQVNTVEELNRLLHCGQFIIGRNDKRAYYQIADVVYLFVNSGDTKERYDLERLQDLESRLVLIAGQSKVNTEVQKFLNVFHTACIIADVLIKLHELGCVLFIGWQRNFSLKSELCELEKEQRHLSEQLRLWNDEIDKARSKCYVLNSFTMKQLLRLRKELRPCFTKRDVSYCIEEQTYYLLKYLYPCADINFMTEKLNETSEGVENDETQVTELQDQQPTTSTPEVQLEHIKNKLTDQQHLKYVELVETQGLEPFWVIAEILKRKDDCSAEEIFMHIGDLIDKEENPSETELLESIRTSLNELGIAGTDISSESKLHVVDVPTELIAEKQQSEMLNKQWLDVPTQEYLSLSDLMNYLTAYRNKMHQAAGEIFTKCRKTNGIDFHPGYINLYVTSNVKILQTALMLYAEDDSLPLPTQEEILICDEKTTAEEVILLWRRAIFDPDFKRIFCLVHGEKLSYSTCEESLRELNRLKQGRTGYRLVIICSNEQSVKSHLIPVLHAYRRNNPAISVSKLRNYLSSHLVRPKYIAIGASPNSTSFTASAVDTHSSYIRIVFSHTPGNGKSLYVRRMGETLKRKAAIVQDPVLTIPIHGPVILNDIILEKLCSLKSNDSRIIHFDIAPSMTGEVECFLFSVLVMGHLKDYKGNTWRREIVQMYAIEVTFPKQAMDNATYHLLSLFPSAFCQQPDKCISAAIPQSNQYKVLPGMDRRKLTSDEYQRVYYYLSQLAQRKNLDSYVYKRRTVMDSPQIFFQVIQRFCQVKSWSEVDHYVHFLNTQLLATEGSIYCNAGWPGFKTFVLKMMIQMSKEFTTTSLMGQQENVEGTKRYEIRHSWNESFHPYLFFNQDQTTFTFIGFCISKNCDAIDPRSNTIIVPQVMTSDLRSLLSQHKVDLFESYYKWTKNMLLEKLARVIGLKCESVGLGVIDPDPSYVITVDNIMKMMAILMRFRCGIPVVIMGETGCGKTRLLRYLCQLASQDELETGEKNIVILKVHGGTTQSDIEEAVKKAEVLAVKKTEALAEEMLWKQAHRTPVFGTILFFDEANTTDHVNLIKEIMCDRKIFGRKIHDNLRVVAACNPYRKHSKEMINKLESAGLGFCTKATQTVQKLGSIPLRQLVYRVNDLPPSMVSLIFDFGRLSQNAEKQYIRKIVDNKLIDTKIKHFSASICDVLSWCQNFMKVKKDECSFVSLRDVDRAVTVLIFFMDIMETLGPLMDRKILSSPHVECKVTRALLLTLGVCYHARLENRSEYEKDVLSSFVKPLVVPSTDSSIFITEIRCCQEVFLDSMKLGKNIARNSALRENVFMMVVCVSLRIPLFLVGKPGSSKSLAKSIILNSMKGSISETNLLQKLKEVQLFSYQCSQLSTSESILKVFTQATNVQNKWDKTKYVAVVVLDEVGLAEDSPNLPLKVLHPLLEDGTEGSNYSLDDVIDRDKRVGFIGLSNWALDPAKMNRGIMVIRSNPSLEELEESALQICSEEGTDEQIKDSMKVYFKSFARAYQNVLNEQKTVREFFGLRDFYSLVKMLFWMCNTIRQPPNATQIKHAIQRNFSGFPEDRGIDIFKHFNNELGTDAPPDKQESWGKCQSIMRNEFRQSKFEHTFTMFFEEFKEKHAKRHEEQFEELSGTASVTFQDYQHLQFKHCYDIGDFEDPDINEKYNAEIDSYSKKRFDKELWPFIINPDNSASGLIISSLINKERTMHGESRYLLFLTENYAALQTLQHFLKSPALLSDDDSWKAPYILFGSSFPKDKDFTQVCRNINNIKVCMETGRTVVLLNLDHLYESLYDALNQYYVYFGNMRFVDLGLQNHRVKCRVHDNFKLILIAEKEKVYKEFPTALINRLEKHFVVTSTILTKEQLEVEMELRNWINKFCIVKNGKIFKPSDSFIGFQTDTPAAVVFKASSKIEQDGRDPIVDWHKEMLKICKFLLLQISTPDALVRLKKSRSLEDGEYEELAKMYTVDQNHRSLKEFLACQIKESSPGQICRMQVTTCNDLLSDDEVTDIRKSLEFNGKVVKCILQEFDTEFEFTRKVRESFQNTTSLLIIQCDSGHLNSDLIACAKYRIDDIWEDIRIASNSDEVDPSKTLCHVLFTILIPREHNESSFVSFLGGDWTCAHIDDFCPDYDYCPVTLAISNAPLSLLFYNPDFAASSQSPGGISFNHCRDLYKNIAQALQVFNPDSKFAERSHELNSTLYRLLKVHPPMECGFYMETVKCIYDELSQFQSQEWIFNAASESRELNEGGAFAKVLLRNLDAIINDTLAKIVAFADRNYNLALIDPKCCVSHVKSFWIIAYSKLIKHHLSTSPEKHGNEVYDCCCQFPFSSELQQAVEVMLRIQGISQADGEVTADHILLKWNLLDEIPETDFDDMQRRYINDLIQFNWSRTYKDKKANDRELEFISRAIIHSLPPKQDGAKFSDLLCDIHETFNKRKTEISNFKDLIVVFPGILEKLTFEIELPLDVQAAIFALDFIDEDHQLMQKGFKSPVAVVNKHHRFYQVTTLIDTALYSVEEHGTVNSARFQWQGLQVVHLFIEHVVKEHMQYFDKTLQYMDRIRSFVTNPSDFAKKLTVRNLELKLSLMHKDFSAAHSQAADDFSQSCIKFYIAVISNICMKRGPPDDELIEKLIETVFTVAQDTPGAQTRELTPFLRSTKFDDSVPVIRSYLLQLLLHNSYHSTRKYIQKYINKAEALVKESGDSTVLTLLKLLYCQLHENSLHGSTVNCSVLLDLLSSIDTKLLTNLSRDKAVNLDSLEAVATIRFALTHLSELLVKQMDQQDNSESYQNLLSSAEGLCKQKTINSITTGPRLFLLKTLYRRCGEVGLQKITCKPSLNWILPERIFDENSTYVFDYFTVYGKEYTEIRELVIDLAVIKDFEKFTQLQEKTKLFLLPLAIFMEITLMYSKKDVTIPENVLQEFRKFVRNRTSTCQESQDLAICLLDNQFSASGTVEQLFVQPQRSLEDKLFTSVVVHVATGIAAAKDSGLIHILYTMMTNPEKLKFTYIPSMPEDFFAQAKHALGSRSQVYICFENHPYVVTECGNPLEEKYCPTCKKLGKETLIGGQSHRLRDDNKPRVSPIQTGYILGVPVESSAVPERSLSPSACTIVRIIVHSILLWTCCSKPDLIEQVNQIVSYDIEPDDLPRFFWQHLVINFNSLTETLSIGLDDAVLLIHIIMAKINKKPQPEGLVFQLLTLQNRQDWEREFNRAYIQPVLKDLHITLEDSKIVILEDGRSNRPALLDYVYERNIQSPDISHHLWKYRPAITLEHLTQQLEVRDLKNTYPALAFFLREEVCLRATKFLPAISQLQHYLHSIHHYRSSHEEIQTKTIRQFLDGIVNDEEREKYESMLGKLRQAWQLVRGKLRTQRHLPDEYVKNDFLDDTTLVHLIPRKDCCTTILTDYLVMLHNDFLKICLNIVREIQTTGKVWKSLRKDRVLKLRNIHESQLLNYDDKLSAIILSHCHYSLTVGQNQTEMDFDFDALEKHLLQEFVYGKPVIENDTHYVEYRKDVYTGKKFENIEEKVKPKVPLLDEAKQELLSKLNRIQQLKEALDHIEIVMGFLSAGGNENGNMSLMKYAVEVLRINKFNRVIGEGHCLGQIRALWDAVSLKLAIEITLTGKVPFNNVLPCFFEPLTDEDSLAIDQQLERVNVDVVLQSLNEFIELHVRNADVNQSRWMIIDCLDGYYGVLPDQLRNEVCIVGNVEMKCVIEVWKKIVFYQRDFKNTNLK